LALVESQALLDLLTHPLSALLSLLEGVLGNLLGLLPTLPHDLTSLLGHWLLVSGSVLHAAVIAVHGALAAKSVGLLTHNVGSVLVLVNVHLRIRL
jgi:hypothetical protein